MVLIPTHSSMHCCLKTMIIFTVFSAPISKLINDTIIIFLAL